MRNIFTLVVCSVFVFASFTANSQTNKNSSLTKIAWLNGTNGAIKFKPQIKLSGNKIFLAYKSAFGLGVNDEMKIIRQENDKLGFVHYRYQQYFKSLPVDGAVYIIHDKNGKANTGNGQIVSGLNIQVNTNISKTEALNIALKEVPSQKYIWQDNESETMLKQIKKDVNATYYPVPELVLFDKKFSKNASSYKLAYKIEIYSLIPLQRKFIYVDAITGNIIHSINMIQHTDVNAVGVTKYNGNQPIVVDSFAFKQFRLREYTRGNGIITKSTQNGEDYNLAVDVTDDSTFFNSDDVAINAHWAAEMTYDYYLNTFSRNSYDNNGAALLSYVHYSNQYANAFWDGTRMTYGDGNSQYTAFTSLEICGHEITHAVTQSTANLVYQDEPGALNESFSDMFGVSIEFFADTTPDWLMGEDIGTPLRSMSNPNDYQNPDTYHGTFWDTDPNNMDNGGVHTNSGVGNYWFYLLTDGGTDTNDNGSIFSVTGLGHASAEAIAYRTLSVYLTPTSQYYDTYLASVQAAEDLFGACSNEVYQTANAWAAVGVGYPYDNQKVYLVDVTSPTTSCGLSYANVSTILFYNGCDTSLLPNDTISLAYQFDSGTKIYENLILSAVWNGGDSLNYTFTTPVDASALGTHTVNCWVKFGSGTSGYNDSIIGYTFNNLLQQNIDVGIVGFSSPISSCSLTNNEPVAVKVHFFGCDSLAMGNTIDIAYRVNNGTPVTEQFVLPTNMYPSDTFTYVFNQKLDASGDGTYTLDSWTAFNVDTLNTNDMFSGYKVKNPNYLGTTIMGFETSNALDYFLINTKQFSNAFITTQAHAPLSAKGLLMTGGNAMLYLNLLEIPTGFNTWLINEFLSAKANFCVDATTWNSAYLKFDLKQTHGGTLYSQYLGGNINDYTIASNMRILTNNTQIGGTYNPSTPGSDAFVTHLIDLTNYAGTDFEFTFETRNIAKDTTIFIPFVLDNAYIDNVHFFPGPLAVDDTIAVSNISSVTIPVLDNDNDYGISSVKFTLLTNPAHGNVTVNSDTTLTYTPNNAYLGYDTLSYSICYNNDTIICDEALVIFRVVESVDDINGIDVNNVYPNPFKDELTLQYSAKNINSVSITISNTLSQTVKSVTKTLNAGTNKITFNLKEQPSGLYFVTIKTKNSVKTLKVTKL